MILALTIFCVIFAIFYTASIFFLLHEFFKLTPYQQAISSVNVNPYLIVVFLFCVSFLISRLFS